MSNSTYQTKQKTVISSALESLKERELTCDEIVDILKMQGTPVGKATLYRFLENLVDVGKVRKTKYPGEKSAKFQYIDEEMNCQSHLHLKCISCGKLIHLGCDFMGGVYDHVLEHHGFVIDNSRTYIMGQCENCRLKEV